jgi:hypothetical protein
MKRTILVAMLMITALSVCMLGQTPSQKSDKDEKTKNEVIALAKAFEVAVAKRDAAAMERILADDYKGISSSGFPVDKYFQLSVFKVPVTGGPPLEAIDLDEDSTSVRVYNETAVLITKVTLKWQGSREELAKKYKMMPKRDDFMMTFVAVKKNGTWQIVSTQETELVLEGQESKPLPKN